MKITESTVFINPLTDPTIRAIPNLTCFDSHLHPFVTVVSEGLQKVARSYTTHKNSDPLPISQTPLSYYTAIIISDEAYRSLYQFLLKAGSKNETIPFIGIYIAQGVTRLSTLPSFTSLLPTLTTICFHTNLHFSIRNLFEQSNLELVYIETMIYIDSDERLRLEARSLEQNTEIIVGQAPYSLRPIRTHCYPQLFFCLWVLIGFITYQTVSTISNNIKLDDQTNKPDIKRITREVTPYFFLLLGSLMSLYYLTIKMAQQDHTNEREFIRPKEKRGV